MSYIWFAYREVGVIKNLKFLSLKVIACEVCSSDLHALHVPPHLGLYVQFIQNNVV